jgi:hypothetical protein
MGLFHRRTEEEVSTPYSGYDVLAKWASPDWDDQTRRAVAERLLHVPPRRFFSEHEAAVLAAVCERVIPQPERQPDQKIPIVPWIDAKLHKDQRDGYRYERLPQQRDAWPRALMGIDQTARALYEGRSFMELQAGEQDDVLRRIERDDPPGEAWRDFPSGYFLKKVMIKEIVKVYYAHPLAWNEIGYNGPSSPRGHVRLWEGGVDPWEAQEGRD